MYNFKYFTPRDKIFLILNAGVSVSDAKMYYREGVLNGNGGENAIFNDLLADYEKSLAFSEANPQVIQIKQNQFNKFLRNLAAFNEEMEVLESVFQKDNLYYLTKIVHQKGKKFEFCATFDQNKNFDSVVWNGSVFSRNGSYIPPEKVEAVIYLEVIKSYFDAFKEKFKVSEEVSGRIDSEITGILTGGDLGLNIESLVGKEKLEKIYDAVVAYSIYNDALNGVKYWKPSLTDPQDCTLGDLPERYLRGLKTGKIAKMSEKDLELKIHGIEENNFYEEHKTASLLGVNQEDLKTHFCDEEDDLYY